MGTTSDAELAARLLPPMLGADGPRTYFLGVQQPAEARGTGGLLGAYAVLRAEGGAVEVVEVGNRDQLEPRFTQEPVRDLDPAYATRYAPWSPARGWLNANVSPHFPDAAQNWLALWRAGGREPLDGALAVDPYVLEAVLGVAGQVRLSDGTVLDGATTADYVLRGVYERYPAFEDNAVRDGLLVELAQDTVDLVTRGAAPARPLVDALAPLVQEGRVLVWSAREEEQAEIGRLRAGGTLSETAQPFAAAVLNDAGGSKLAPYVSRTLRYTAQECTGQRRTAALEVVLGTDVPEGLPPYVVDRVDVRDRQEEGEDATAPPPGQQRLYLSVYATAGARATAFLVDGEPVPYESAVERGHPVVSTYLELPPTGSTTVVVELDEPQALGEAVVREQPLVLPQVTEVAVPPCGRT